MFAWALECSVCPAGRYGSEVGLPSAACSGPCDVGFTCPAGSEVSTGGVISEPSFAATYPAVALDYGAQPGLGPGDALVRRGWRVVGARALRGLRLR
jgi:hypothetical protein